VRITLALLCALVGVTFAAPVALIVDAPAPLSPAVASAFHDEVDLVFRDTGYQFSWVNRAEMRPDDSFPDLVMVRLKSECRLDGSHSGAPSGKPMALAWAHRSGDEVLPFIEVDCGRVRNMLRVLAHGEPAGVQQEMMGRALGRVVAHELYHVLTGNSSHSHAGIAQASLSALHLAGPALEFTRREVNLLSRRSFAARQIPPSAAAFASDELASESGR
jgi:hypothetical protein